MSLRTRLRTLISRPIRAVLIAPLLVAGTLLAPGPAGQHLGTALAESSFPDGFAWVDPYIASAGVEGTEQVLAYILYAASVNVWLAPNPTVNWGDGSIDTPNIDDATVYDSHNYAAPGIYRITITYNTGCCISYTATTWAFVGGSINGAQTVPLGRFFAPGLGHWVDAEALDSIQLLPPQGYQLESIDLGYLLATRQPGTSALYSCLAGATDQFVSKDPNCEGQQGLGLLGYIYNTLPQGRAAVQLWRCYAGGDHFVSTDVYCEGQHTEALLGYALLYAQ